MKQSFDVGLYLTPLQKQIIYIGKPPPPPKTRRKLNNTLALPALLYGSENWTIEARDAGRITAAEMKCMRRTAGYIWTDHKTHT
jgi:hypothetical protein